VSHELLGAALALVASCLYALAVALQALEARRVEAHHALRLSLLDRLARRPLWLIGSGVGLLGWAMQAAALLFAPLTLVEPVLATSLVLLMVVGARVLGEHVGGRERFGVAAIAVGVVGVTATAPGHAAGHPDRPGVTLALAVMACLVAAPHAWRRSPPPPLLVPVSAGVGYAMAAIATKFAADDLRSHAWQRSAGWLALTAAVGALAVLSEMSAFQAQPVTRVAPIVFGLNVGLPVLLAPALAGEAWSSARADRLLLAASLCAVLTGAVLLSRSRALGVVLASEAEAAAAHGVPHTARAT
jgi:hypothetical protein